MSKVLLSFLYWHTCECLEKKMFILDFKVSQIFNFWDRWMKVRSPQGQKRLVRLREMGRHFTPASAPWYLYVPWSQTIWPQVLNSLELSGTLHEDKNPVSPTLFFSFPRQRRVTTSGFFVEWPKIRVCFWTFSSSSSYLQCRKLRFFQELAKSRI